MKMVKSLILGSAAGLLAMSGAQAADLPVKAKAVEYVRICSLYGAGFFYIPGTDTCIKLGGYLRVDTSFNSSGTQDAPAWNGDPGQQNRYRDYFATRARLALTVDTIPAPPLNTAWFVPSVRVTSPSTPWVAQRSTRTPWQQTSATTRTC